MAVQFRNKKVINHGSIPITIDGNVLTIIVLKRSTPMIPPAHEAHQTDNFSRCIEINLFGSNTDFTPSDSEAEINGWTIINEEVDMVTPMIISHLKKLGIEHLQLPDMKESICLKPLFITYEAGLYLTNGIVYNLFGIFRHGNAYMTYQGKAFVSRFYIKINNLQFEYNFLLKVMAAEGLGRVIGSLENTIIYADLSVNIANFKFHLNDFRIIRFSHPAPCVTYDIFNGGRQTLRKHRTTRGNRVS
ncbi:uncharacterized protein LOC108025560 isoform X3 [Drosophila biarmipes]|uniref:uncharacterized protein LOC108025560 isoform X3 n=1 Tax=Drosophila biarmipes TaxID=125945 RepID=UPI001CDA7885|nr:uncharacterized protein LOC108025560 isoform X3 [Drosophila biarmipes]